jgi:hypothetical protein
VRPRIDAVVLVDTVALPALEHGHILDDNNDADDDVCLVLVRPRQDAAET